MAVAFRSASSGTDLTTALPSGHAQDDILLAQVSCENNGVAPPTAATGWTQIDGYNTCAEAARPLAAYWFWIARGAGTPATNWSWGQPSEQVSYLCYSGGHLTAPVVDYAKNTTAGGGDAIWECLTFTNNVDQSMEVAMGALNQWQTSTSTMTNERVDGGATLAAHFYDHGLIGTGSVSQKTITSGAGWHVIHLALRPAAGGAAGDVTPAARSIGHPALGFQFTQLHSNGPLASQDFTVTSSAFVGAVALSGSAFPEPSAVSLAAVGILPQSGTARPEPSAVTVARVGVLGQSGAASPSPSAVSQALVGILSQASSARPEPAAATLALIGVQATSLPTSTADLTVVGLAVVGVVVTSLPLPAPSAATIALAGVQARSGSALPELSATAKAYIGVQSRGAPTITVTASGLAVVGVQPTSLPTSTSDISVASLALVGVTTRSSVNSITITGTSLAAVGVQARSQPTITTTASGLIVVGAQPRSGAQVEWIVVSRSYAGVYVYGLVGLPDIGPYAPADNRVLRVIRTSYIVADPARPSRTLAVRRPSYVVVVLVDRPSQTD